MLNLPRLKYHDWKAIQERCIGIPGVPICSYEEWLDRAPEWVDSAGLNTTRYVLLIRMHAGT